MVFVCIECVGVCVCVHRHRSNLPKKMFSSLYFNAASTTSFILKDGFNCLAFCFSWPSKRRVYVLLDESDFVTKHLLVNRFVFVLFSFTAQIQNSMASD